MTSTHRFTALPANRPWLQAVLLAASALLLLMPILGAEFIWDDISQIAESESIGDWSRVPAYFTLNVVQSKGDRGRNAEGIDLYRPLFVVALTAIHAINGADSFWFHIAVVAAHLLVCLLLWELARRWLESPVAAAVTFALFAFHPVTAEAYLWASAISEPMSVAGLLAATLVLDRRCHRGQAAATAWPAAILAAAALLLGLLAKEAMLTALPVVSVLLWRVRRVPLRFHVPCWLAAAVFLGVRSVALDGMQAAGQGWEQRLQALRNLPVLIVDGLCALLTMWPIGIRHLSYEYESVSWPASATAAVVVAVALWGAIRARQQRPLTLAAVCALVLMMAPIALVATVPGWGGFGRYLYLPWAFACLALADTGRVLLGRAGPRWARQRVVIIAVIAGWMVVEQAGLRYALHVYSCQESLAENSIALHPEVPDGYEWLGTVHLDRGDVATALFYYTQAMKRGPDLYSPRQNVAAALLSLGRPEQALAQVRTAEETHGITAESSLVAARALAALGRWSDAADRTVWILDQLPERDELAALQRELLARHPEPAAYRAWLARVARKPENAGAAPVIRSILGENYSAIDR